MRYRMLLIVAIVALLSCFAPSIAYADLFSELEDYDGDMWRNNVSENAQYGSSTSTTYGSLSVQLILSDIYQYNTDLLTRAQSPAAQLAIQLTQLDFIRGAYGRLTQIKNQVENIYLDTAYIRSMITQISSDVGSLRYNLSLIKTAADSLDGNVDTILQNQVVIGSGIENIRQNLISANGNLSDINSGINGTGSTSVRSLLSTLAANQLALSNQLRNYFAADVDGNGTKGTIYGKLVDIENGILDIVDRETSIYDLLNANFLNTTNNWLRRIHEDLQEIDVTFPNSISIDNWPSQPISVNVGNLPEFPSLSPVIDAINRFANKFDFIGYNGWKFLAVWWPYSNYENQDIPYLTVRHLDEYISELFNYLTNQDGVLKQIRDLLSVSNPDELVGDFDSVEFDTNVDNLVSRIATVAPFGALLMVSAELDILHSVSAIQNPSFVIPFEFFGQETVTIDLSFLADAKPLFNFVVVFGFIYMLLIYSIDFIKEGEL